LIPHYLFAVLLEKVKTLRSLARLADGERIVGLEPGSAGRALSLGSSFSDAEGQP
jgi:hypothetical protein